MTGSEIARPTAWERAAARLITGWALLGGVVLLAIVLMNVASVTGAMFGAPFPGDFEMTEIGVAIAAFAFLPWCQMTGANVTADIFTARAPARLIAGVKFIASLIALGFALLLLDRMFAGMMSQREYGYVTAILQFPVWLGFLPALISLVLLALAALLSLREAAHEARARHG